MANINPRITVYFDREVIDKIKKLAEREHLSASAYIRRKMSMQVERDYQRLYEPEGAE